jgi:hypothetical protein
MQMSTLDLDYNCTMIERHPNSAYGWSSEKLDDDGPKHIG